MSLSKLTKYWACHEKWISWLILVTHETLFTMRGVTTVIVQTHQILRLPRKMNLMIDPCHTWNAIYNARSNKCHCPNSPNTAPATQSNTHHWSLSHMKRYLQCAEQQVSLSKLTKYCACHAKWLSWYCHDWSSSHMKRYLQCAEQQVASSNITKYCACHAKWFSKISETFLQNRWNVNSNARPIRDRSENDPSMIRPWSEHDPSMKPSLRHPPRNRAYFSRPPRAFCIEKYNISRSGYHSKFHRILRLPRKVTVQHHQILRLPRKMNLMIDPCHTWNAIYNARSNKCHCPNSPNTAPATKNESHDWSLSHMKRYLQCAEQQVSSWNISEYCACHAKWLSNISKKFLENSWNVISNAGPIRAWSELDPSWIRAGSDHETVIRNPPRNRGYFSRPPRAFWQHFALRLSFQISPNTAPAKKSDTSTSPNTAPATQNDCHNWSSSHVKRYFQCAEQPVSSWNISEYCACHAKWLSNISKKFLENSWNVISNAGPIREWSENDPRMIRAGNRPPQPASQPRLLFTPTTSILYWKIQHFALRLSFQISPNTAPATKSDSSTSPNTAPATQSDSSTSPNTAPATQSNCHDWSLSHMKCHLQCAEQPVSSSNITEYCACHAKWLS